MFSKVIPILTGPTGSGKSNLLNNFIKAKAPIAVISADAFQVYRHFNIGTAKPSEEIRNLAPHYLIDILDGDKSYNAADFVCQAEQLIEELLTKGITPVVSGGTALYIQSLVKGMFECPSTDPDYRMHISKQISTHGSLYVYESLKKIDPIYAEKIHPNDVVRIIRAMEVYNSTGMNITEAHYKYHKPPKFKYDIMVIEEPRQSLYDNINYRVLDMFEKGWVKETEKILNMGIKTTDPSFRAIGYKEIALVINKVTTIEDAINKISQQTRNYAKRQLTWYRNMDDAFFMTKKNIKLKLESYLY